MGMTARRQSILKEGQYIFLTWSRSVQNATSQTASLLFILKSQILNHTNYTGWREKFFAIREVRPTTRELMFEESIDSVRVMPVEYTTHSFMNMVGEK